MTLLRVALITLHHDRLHVHCFGELAQLAAAVQILLSNSERRFALDAGFEDFESRPSDPDLLFGRPGRVLISDRALSLLKHFVSAEPQLVTEMGGVPFYEALTVWGHVCKAPQLLKAACQPVGWVAQLSGFDPSLAEHSKRAGIWDEESYRTFEANLSGTLRVALARSRFTLLAGSPPSPLGILDKIGCCPSWVQERRFDTLPINVRQANVMRAYRFTCIGDLAKAGTNGLLKLPNLGLKSVRELGHTVYDVLLSEPGIAVAQIGSEALAKADIDVDNLTFFDSLDRWLDSEDATMARVMRGRWGINTEKLTLQQLAASVGVTRERVRQIEVKGLAKLKQVPLWQELASRIEALLSERDSPLSLDDLRKEDPWFASDTGSTIAIGAAIQNFLEGRIHTFSLNAEVVVTRLSETDWIRALNDARMILGDLSSSGSAVRAERLVASILAKEGAELRGLLLAMLDVEDPSIGQGPKSNSQASSEDDELARKLKAEMLRRQLSRVV